jgi:hypothetical protein
VYSTALGRSIPVSGLTVRVLDGLDKDKSSTTAADGTFSLPEIHAATITLHLTKDGYQVLDVPVTVPQTLNITPTVRRVCEDWPPEIVRDELSRLPVVENLCLVTFLDANQASNYVAQLRTVFYRSPAPGTGRVGALCHELGHAHQHRMILDAGLGEPGFDDTFVPMYASTREGQRLVELTGWLHDAAARQGFPPFGWACNNRDPDLPFWNSCGYQNPIEDGAQFTCNWYNPGGVHNFNPLSAAARAQWAREYLPK